MPNYKDFDLDIQRKESTSSCEKKGIMSKHYTCPAMCLEQVAPLQILNEKHQ